MSSKLEEARQKAAEKAEAERIAAEQAKDLEGETKPSKQLAAAAAKAEKDVIALDDPDENVVADRPEYTAASRKILLIAMSYPQTTPNEHPIFGFAGHRFTLGDLRDLTGLPRLR
jgi:hypothetical protein